MVFLSKSVLPLYPGDASYWNGDIMISIWSDLPACKSWIQLAYRKYQLNHMRLPHAYGGHFINAVINIGIHVHKDSYLRCSKSFATKQVSYAWSWHRPHCGCVREPREERSAWCDGAGRTPCLWNLQRGAWPHIRWSCGQALHSSTKKPGGYIEEGKAESAIVTV